MKHKDSNYKNKVLIHRYKQEKINNESSAVPTSNNTTYTKKTFTTSLNGGFIRSFNLPVFNGGTLNIGNVFTTIFVLILAIFIMRSILFYNQPTNTTPITFTTFLSFLDSFDVGIDFNKAFAFFAPIDMTEGWEWLEIIVNIFNSIASVVVLVVELLVTVFSFILQLFGFLFGVTT